MGPAAKLSVHAFPISAELTALSQCFRIAGRARLGGVNVLLHGRPASATGASDPQGLGLQVFKISSGSRKVAELTWMRDSIVIELILELLGGVDGADAR